MIPTDGRGHDKNADAMAMGDSIGHWEGDTFVVDVTNFSPDTRIRSRRLLARRRPARYRELHAQRQHADLTWLRWKIPHSSRNRSRPKPVALIQGAPGKHADEDYPCVEQDQAHMVGTQRH